MDVRLHTLFHCSSTYHSSPLFFFNTANMLERNTPPTLLLPELDEPHEGCRADTSSHSLQEKKKKRGGCVSEEKKGEGGCDRREK